MRTLILSLLLLCCAISCKKEATETSGKIRVAITIDDLPASGPDTPGLTREQILDKTLEFLKENQVPKALGFLNGLVLENQAARYEILKKWKRSGHLIGNHTYSHFDYGKVDFQDLRKDIERNESFLLDFADSIPEIKTFRFPFLQEGDTQEKRYLVREYFQKRGYRNAQVTIDFHDWAFLETYNRCSQRQDSKGMEALKGLYLSHAEKSLEFSLSASNVIWGKRDIPHILLLHLNSPTAMWGGDVLKLMKKRGVVFIDPLTAINDELYNEDTAFWASTGKSFIHQALESRKILGQKQDEIPYEDLAQICK